MTAMFMTRRIRPLIVCALALAAASAVTTLSAQGPDRRQPPPLGPPPALRLPAVQKGTLANGVPLWLIEQHRVPLVQVNVLLRGGSSLDRAGRYGMASLVAAMLDEGAGSRSALELADAVEFLGAELSTSSSFDYSAIRMSSPVRNLDAALPLMADVLLRPTFPANELDRLRKERLTALVQAQDNPAAIIGYAFPRVVFGPAHRYGTPATGLAPALTAITPDDVRAFYREHYTAGHAAVVVVGDITLADAKARLDRAFTGWSSTAGAAPTAAPIPTAPQLTRREVVIIDKPGAAQSQIRIGWVGVPRSTGEYAILQVLNTILGGSFTSRLNQNLRELHLRGLVGLRHAHVGGALPRRCRCADRQDRRGAPRVLCRARRHQEARAGRRARQGQELCGARLPRRVRNLARSRAEARRDDRLLAAR